MTLPIVGLPSQIATTLAIMLLIMTGGFLGGCDSRNYSGFVTQNGSQSVDESAGDTDPPEVAAGERLFVETRFAQFFRQFIVGGGKVNDRLPTGDPVMDTTMTTGQPLPGPFAGLSMNCRACHLVDEQLNTPGGGMRTYADFARRSPIPARSDGKTTTPRNSPPLVNSALPRPGGPLFHFDTEFNSLPDLVKGTLTGRNYGWLHGEEQEAIAHIAQIIREDNGQGDLAKQFGGLSFAVLLAGTDPSIPDQYRIPEAYRINVAAATDLQIFDTISQLVTAYVENLVFAQDGKGNFNASPFDVFLIANGLPQAPDGNETPLDYGRRLLTLIKQREQGGGFQFVTSNPNTPDGKFQFHNQPFQFGNTELQGLKIFLSEPQGSPASPSELTQGKIGNCLACHAPPTFTDFKFHNTGTTQLEYEAVNGPDTFLSLPIPDLATRNAAYDTYLPATALHPLAKEPFRSPPSASNPMLTDLGVWNVFANPDIPLPQTKIRDILCGNSCPSDSQLLPLTIAVFKTPGLRDLGHSAPYMHNGQFDTLESIINFYQITSGKARGNTLRNGAAELQRIALTAGDVDALAAFLMSLNEDYS